MKHIFFTMLTLITWSLVACADNQPQPPAENINNPAAQGSDSEAALSQPGTIVDVVSEAGIFNTLLAAATAADLVDVLNSDGPFTVFAPTDEAFAKLPEGTVESLLLPENKDTLTQILLYHVVAGEVLAEAAIAAAQQNASVDTVSGQSIQLSLDGSNLKINQSTVTAADVAASNGVIHIIDAVLLP